MNFSLQGRVAWTMRAAVAGWLAAGSTLIAADAVFHHVHLSTTDVPAAVEWYAGNLGGERTQLGPFKTVTFGKTVFIFFKVKPGLEGSVGSSVDHIGFSYPDIAAKLKELEAAGVEIVSGVEQEGPIKYAFVKDPWGTLIEVVEDPEIEGFHHAHLATTDPQATLEWYTKAFGGQVAKFGGIVPGVRYGDVWLLAKKVSDQRAPTKGRAIDHLSWGFQDLDADAERLEAQGVKFESKPINFGNAGRIAFIEAPDGVRIELVGPPKKP